MIRIADSLISFAKARDSSTQEQGSVVLQYFVAVVLAGCLGCSGANQVGSTPSARIEQHYYQKGGRIYATHASAFSHVDDSPVVLLSASEDLTLGSIFDPVQYLVRLPTPGTEAFEKGFVFLSLAIKREGAKNGKPISIEGWIRRHATGLSLHVQNGDARSEIRFGSEWPFAKPEDLYAGSTQEVVCGDVSLRCRLLELETTVDQSSLLVRKGRVIKRFVIAIGVVKAP